MTTPAAADVSKEFGASVSAASYDAVPYSVNAFRQTDPGRLAVISHILGLHSASPLACRVLELGCASGGNLIPMAIAYPQSHFVGIDLSKRQVDEGLAVVRELGLANLELHHMSITDVTPALGMFDYILAHGVYSWVPPAVQDKILDICRDSLNPDGVAYVSYNTYPGWHTRRRIREMLCHHTQAISDPLERTRRARETLVFLGNYYGAAKTSIGSHMAQEITQLLKSPDTYLLHEYLEEFNEPLYFHEFMARAAKKNLQFLAEADIADMLPARLGKEADQWLHAASADPLELEQNMDFLKQRMFRQTLLCHASVELDHKLRSDAVTQFHITTPLKPESKSPEINSNRGEVFADANRPTLTIRAPILKAAMLSLCDNWPIPLPFDALLDRARERLTTSAAGSPPDRSARAVELAEALLKCFTAGVVEFTTSPPLFTTTISECPLTNSYIRLRARLGNEVTNLRIEDMGMADSARLVLAQLDGTHNKPFLIDLIAAWLQNDTPETKPGAHRARAEKYIDFILPKFAQSALLIG